jgi:two-component system NtrC family sensor kinase
MCEQDRRILFDVGERISSLLKGKIPEKISVVDYPNEAERHFIEITNQLIDASSEIQKFIVPLSQGELHSFVPKRGNIFSSPFKELHARLLHLTWQTERVAEGDYTQHVDFMGDFSTAFNSMVARLAEREKELRIVNEQLEERVTELAREISERERAQAELEIVHKRMIETAHKAGMAEVATEVLHNVGNVLNSVNVSTTAITEKIKNSEVSNLGKAISIINEHIDDLEMFLAEDLHGKHIPRYLTEVSKLLINERGENLKKLQKLSENIRHINDIISTQQSYAKVAGVEVTTSLAELVEDAIQINNAGLQRHGTRIIREFEEFTNVEINKQKVLQILVNLISNAKYATSSSGKEEKIITIRIYRHLEDRFRIEVTDNGIGIQKDNLTKIFTHGFTTKRRGHGFGLHNSALASSQMGGSLTAHSDGIKYGATFTLELPFKPVKVLPRRQNNKGIVLT